MSDSKSYSIQEALKAQSALRSAAGLEPELFPIRSIVGMISDEIEVLRQQGKTDSQIASLIRDHSGIEITSDDVSENYAPPEQRHSDRG
jgi:hypothetical protein